MKSGHFCREHWTRSFVSPIDTHIIARAYGDLTCKGIVGSAAAGAVRGQAGATSKHGLIACRHLTQKCCECDIASVYRGGAGAGGQELPNMAGMCISVVCNAVSM